MNHVKTTFRIFLMLTVMTVLLIPANAADYQSYSDARAPLGGYTATLEQMAAKRLYAYGILDEPAAPDNGAENVQDLPSTEDKTKPVLPMSTDGVPSRLDVALLLYRICGEQVDVPCRFSDVPESYADAVSWLAEAGGTKGVWGGLYGTGPSSEDQFITILSRLLDWRTEELSILETITEKYGIEHLQSDDGSFTYGELYQMACGLIDYAYPERCVPVNGKEATPESIELFVDSYSDAMRQIHKAVTYLPRCIEIHYSDACSKEDIQLCQKCFTWSNGAKTMPMLELADTWKVMPFSLQSAGHQHDRIVIGNYSQAATATASVTNWLTVFADEAFSSCLMEFYLTNVFPLKRLPAYDRALRSHDIICRLASYDNSEYDEQTKSATGVRPKAHKLLGFFENGKIVCDGYANLYSWLLMELDVDNYIVYGNADGGGHAWNKVNLLGNWYNVDVCWDDQGLVTHNFFLKSDDYMDQNRHRFKDVFSGTAFSSEGDFSAVRATAELKRYGEFRFDFP